MVAMRAASKQQNWLHKLVAGPSYTAVLENSRGKTLDIQKKLTDVMHQVKLFTGKSTYLFDALIGKQDLNDIQGAIDQQLTKMLAHQEYSMFTMQQLEIQQATT